MSTTVAAAATDRTDVSTILRTGTGVGLLTAGGVVLYLAASRTLPPGSLVAQSVEALVVLATGTVAAFLPGLWCAARRFDGIAAAAAAGLWGTVVFAVCDIAVLRPLKAYPWTWDAVGGGSTWWYLPVWWMLGTFIAWMGGIRVASSAAHGRTTLVQTAAPVWVATVLVAALAHAEFAILPVATGLGFALSVLAFALVALIRRP